MLKLRPLLRHTRRPLNQILHSRARLQHGTSGPHKEYFQTPAQAQNIVKDFGYRPEHVQQALQFSKSDQPSRFMRLLRSATLFTTFLLVGWFAGQALITWEYFQPHYEDGSEEDLEYTEDINEILLSSPLISSLVADGWLPLDAWQYEFEKGSKHMLHETLRGPKGITVKYFRHPTHKAAAVAFFLGSGIEGWPDVAHGGVVATLVEETFMKVVKDNFKDLETIWGKDMLLEYHQPMRPGMVYGLVLAPETFERIQHEPGVGDGKFMNRYVGIVFTGDAPSITAHGDILVKGPQTICAFARAVCHQIPEQFRKDWEAQLPPEQRQRNLNKELDRIHARHLKEEEERKKKALENLSRDQDP